MTGDIHITPVHYQTHTLRSLSSLEKSLRRFLISIMTSCISSMYNSKCTAPKIVQFSAAINYTHVKESSFLKLRFVSHCTKRSFPVLTEYLKLPITGLHSRLSFVGTPNSDLCDCRFSASNIACAC